MMLRMVAGALALSVLPPPGFSARAQEPASFLISTEWLADHLNDPDLAILHVAMSHDGAPKELIPGARVLDYHAITEDRGELPVEMRPVPELVKVFEEAGVSHGQRVVIYGEGWPHLAARVFVTLDYLGHANLTSVLDGGLEAWKAEGRPLVAQPATPGRGRFTPRPRSDMLVSAEWLASRLNDAAVKLIDARPPEEYTGERRQEGLRGGHIPGAYNLYYQDLVISRENPRLRELDYVKARQLGLAAGGAADGVGRPGNPSRSSSPSSSSGCSRARSRPLAPPGLRNPASLPRITVSGSRLSSS